jgi:peptide/nickel transport system permease protein
MATVAPVTQSPPATIDFETTKEIGFYRLVWRRFRTRKIALAASGFLLFIVLACLIIPMFLAPDQALPGHVGEGMSAQHPFGTDDSGRDIFTRVLLGGRISLMVGFLSMTVTITLATTAGALGGYFGGAIDSVLAVITNSFLSMPALLILIIFEETLGQGSVLVVVLGISLVSWPSTSRLVRSVVLSLREKEFVEAVRALGTSRTRIILKHILPNALGTIIVSATLTIALAILLESALSFLGVGIGAPIASWGGLLEQGQEAITRSGDFLFSLWPGLCILFTVLCFNYLGDALNDAFDPRALER